jgi:maltooligosyltrehalose trehalohydrolase
MKKDESGYWKTNVANLPAGSRYKFVVEDQEFPDPASISQPAGVHESSQVADRNFQWTDMSWQGIALQDMIIYELHVGTFTPKGDFESVTEKLDYLQGLGVNTIELMPVAQFPGERNWGYDGVCIFATQNSYGGSDALKRLVDEAHRRDMAVILDVVYNHFGPEGNYMDKFGPYFTPKYNTFWGKAVNFDDAYCDGVRNYFFQNALMWLSEFHIDGLRLDAVHAIWDFSAMPFVAQLASKVKTLETQSGRHKVLIAEFDLNNPRYISSPSKGGFGLDGQWMDEFHHAIHAVTTDETNGYYEDFGTTKHVAKAIRDSYVYTGQYSVHRKKTFGVYPLDNPYSQFVVFAQNHDQVGNRLAGDRLSTQLSFEGLKLVAASYLLTPHVPLIFMGEEYGETNPFQYFISNGDQKLVEEVRAGRKKEFAHFNWKDEVPDPQDEKTFQACKLSWQMEDEKRKILLEYYRSLIAFRKTRRAYFTTERNSLRVYPETESVVCFEKFSPQDKILVVLNFAKNPQEFTNPIESSIKKIFDSSARSWLGNSDFTNEIVAATSKIFLQSESAQIFEMA